MRARIDWLNVAVWLGLVPGLSALFWGSFAYLAVGVTQ